MATHSEVAAMLAGRGFDDQTREALAGLTPADAIEAIAGQPYLQHAAAALAADPERLADALYARFERADFRQRVVLLGALLGLHRARGSALEPRFDDLLRSEIQTTYVGDVEELFRGALLAMPAARREALVVGSEIAWRYLGTCDPENVVRAVVREAIATATVSPFPADHPIVAGLAELGAAGATEITQRLVTGSPSTAAQAVLVAALARIAARGEALYVAAVTVSSPQAGAFQKRTTTIQVLQAACRSADPVARRFARDGLDAMAADVPRELAAPAPLVRVISIRRSLDPSLRDGVRELAEGVERDIRERRTSPRDAWLARALPGPPLEIACALADLWLGEVRLGRHPIAYPAGLRMIAELDDPLVHHAIAETLCRYPPVAGDPFQPVLDLYRLVGELPRATEHAIACALAAILSPDDAGNPQAVYDWLVTREPAVPRDCPAFALGARAADPGIRAACERALAGPPAPRPFSLRALRDAFAPIANGGYWGNFGLVAIDHANAESVLVVGEDREAAPPVLSTERRDAGALLAEALPIVSAAIGYGTAAAGPWTSIDRARACARLAELIRSDRTEPSVTVASSLAETVFALVPEAVACCEGWGAYDHVAMSHAMTVQDRAGTFSLCFVYLNDQ